MITSRTHRWRTTTSAALVVTAALTGCGAQPADRTGGDTVVLRLATIDGDINGNGQAFGPETFVEELVEVSGGRLQVEVTTGYGDGAADAESRLVEAMASGEVDGGWPSTRAFAAAGIRGLEAVEAPMTLVNSAAVAELVSGPAGETALGLLGDTGVTGLALSSGPLRRPFAAGQPLLGPADWAGQPFRVYNSQVQADTVTALGGTPVNAGIGWVDEVLAGQLRGAEFDVAQYAANGLATEAGTVTANVVLWPKVFVLALSEERFGSLTGQQQEWVREAAERAEDVSVDAAVPDGARVEELCARGVRFIPADEGQLAALQAAVAPVVDDLAVDPVTAPLMEQVRAVAQKHPEVEAVDVPPDCRTPLVPGEELPVQTEDATLPEGVYRVELTVDDVRAAGHDNGPDWSGTWTLEIEDGTYVLTCRPVADPGRDCGNSSSDGPLEAGKLRGAGQTVTFVFDVEMMAELTGCRLPAATGEGACYSLGAFTLEWSVDGDELTFRQVGGTDAHSYTVEPWCKIA